jgi:hypothetical protein
MGAGDLAQSLGALSQETGFLARDHMLAQRTAMQEQGRSATSSA